jgi:2-oxoglutarate/2-oxoacid ferredoxin oxidoreductase subunit beta
MKSLASVGHDQADRIQAMTLAQDYGKTLYTGVFYKDENPAPTFEQGVADRYATLGPRAMPRERILDAFAPR